MITVLMRGDIMRLATMTLLLLIILAVGAAGEEAPEYRLQVGDMLRFTVWDETGLLVETNVLPDGSISFPLVGRIVVEGMTLAQVENICNERLKTYYVNPIATVIVLTSHIPEVKILGRVTSPGKYKLKPGDTLIDVIAYAGGFASRCDIKHILIINRNSAKMVNIKSYIKGEGALPDTDLTIYDGDLIMVPEVLRPDYAKVMGIVNGIVQSLIIRKGGGSSPSA